MQKELPTTSTNHHESHNTVIQFTASGSGASAIGRTTSPAALGRPQDNGAGFRLVSGTLHEQHEHNESQHNDNHFNPSSNEIEHSLTKRNEFAVVSQNVQKSSYNTTILLERNKHADVILVQEIFWGRIKNVPDASSPEGIPYLNTVAHPSFTCYGAGPQSRVAIYLNKKWCEHPVIPLSHLTQHQDLFGLTIQTGSESMTILNIYNEPRNHQAIQRLAQIAPNLPPVQILAGDFNSKHHLWDPSVPETLSPADAELLIEVAMCELNLMVANDTGRPTWRSNNLRLRPQVLDLVWMDERTSVQATPIFIDLDGRNRSDHAILSWSIANEMADRKKPTIGKSSVQAARYINDVTEGLENLQTRIPSFTAARHVEEATQEIERILQEAWNANARTPEISKHSKSWWNVDCTVRARQVKSLRAQMRQLRGSERAQNQDRIKEAQSDLRKCVRTAKRKFFNTIIQDIPSNKIWDLVGWTKARKNKEQNVLTNQTGEPILDDTEMANTLNAQYAPLPSRETEEPSIVREMPQLQEREWVDISPNEVDECLASTTNTSAPGPDHCNWLWLKKIIKNETTIWFAHLFSACVRFAIYPKIFKDSCTVVIPKPNKKSYDKPKSFRPIVLLNCMAKLLEKVLAKRIQFDGQKFGILHPCQFGGTAQHSTVDAAIHLVHNIKSAWQDKRASSALLFDIAQYYPSIEHNHLLKIMSKQGFSRKLCQFMDAYLKDRTTAYIFNGRRLPEVELPSGIGQGSAMSPVLSGIYLAPIVHKHSPIATRKMHEASLQFFVNDGLIHVAAPALANLGMPGDQLQINTAILANKFHAIAEDLRSVGLYVEPDKFEVMHFRRDRTPWTSEEPLGPSIALKVPNRTRESLVSIREVVPAKSVRYLGFMLDPKLTWKTHIKTCVNKACSTVNSLRMLGNSVTGLSPKDKRALYISNVLPLMTYGAAAWWQPNWKGKQWIVGELQKAQTKAARWISGGFRTTPRGALEMAAGLVPIKHQVDRLMKNACLRTRMLHHGHPMRSILPEYWVTNDLNMARNNPKGKNKNKAFNVPAVHIDTIGRTCNEDFDLMSTENRPGSRVLDLFHSQITFNVDAPKKHSPEFNEWMRSTFWKKIENVTNDPNAISLYTDGSKKTNAKTGDTTTGAAWLILNQAMHVCSGSRACGKATPYDAEMEALARGIKQAVKKSTQQIAQIHIFTDNKSAINKILRTGTASGQLLTIKASQYARKFLQNRPDRSIHFHWCPSHVDVPGNEYVDKLAGEAASQSKQPNRISLGEAKRTHKKHMQQRWKDMANGKTYKGNKFLFSPASYPEIVLPNKRNWFQKTGGENPTLLARLIRAASGHAPIGEYCERFNLPGPRECECGYKLETRNHILFECPLWIRNYYGQPSPPRRGAEEPIRGALFESDTEDADEEEETPTGNNGEISPETLLWFLKMNPMAFTFEWAELVEQNKAIRAEDRLMHLPIFRIKTHTTLKAKRWNRWRVNHIHDDWTLFQWDAEKLARRAHQGFWNKRRGIG